MPSKSEGAAEDPCPHAAASVPIQPCTYRAGHAGRCSWAAKLRKQEKDRNAT